MSTLKVEKIQHPNSASVALTLDTSGYLALQAGSASTPAIQGPSDPNTGIFFPAADTIAFAEGGTEVLRIDSNGRVGLGNSSPSKLLTIGNSSTANTTVRVNCSQTAGSDTAMYSFGIDDTTDFAGIRLDFTDRTTKGLQIFTAPAFGYPISFSGSSGNQDVTIDTSGRVGVGTTSPSAKLAVVYSTNGIELDPQFGFVSGTVRAYDRTTSSYKALGLTGDSVVFGISDIEKARIDSSGRLLVGTSSASGGGLLQVAGIAQATKFSSNLSGQTASLANGSSENILSSLSNYSWYLVYAGGRNNTSVMGTAFVEVNGAGTPFVTQLTGTSSGIVIEASGNNVRIRNATATQAYWWKGFRLIGLDE